MVDISDTEIEALWPGTAWWARTSRRPRCSFPRRESRTRACPAQRYFTLGLHAARESSDPRALPLQLSLLADMSRQMIDLGHPASGLKLVEAALALVPRGRHPAAAAMLWSLKALMLGALGPGAVREMISAIGLAQDLLGDAGDDKDDLTVYTGPAELAALALQDAAEHTPSLAAEARRQALTALDLRPEGFSRLQVFDQISVCAAGFIGIDPAQAAADGHTAPDLAAQVATYRRVTDRLVTLLRHSEPHADLPVVAGFRERLRTELAAA
jgi:hypothetical protein